MNNEKVHVTSLHIDTLSLYVHGTYYRKILCTKSILISKVIFAYVVRRVIIYILDLYDNPRTPFHVFSKRSIFLLRENFNPFNETNPASLITASRRGMRVQLKVFPARTFAKRTLIISIPKLSRDTV